MHTVNILILCFLRLNILLINYTDSRGLSVYEERVKLNFRKDETINIVFTLLIFAARCDMVT